MRFYLVIFIWLLTAVTGAMTAASDELSKLEPLTIVSGDDANMFITEIADTPQLRARGLMFRHRLPENQAMLFDFEKPRPASMWMKNTYMSLDMLFVRDDGTIAAIAENTVPKSLDTIGVQEPVRGVIELAAGTVKRFNIKVDDKVFHRIFKTAEIEPAFGASQ